MTFRIYVRWPDQRVSDKTVSESRSVADFAYAELSRQGEDLKTRGALGIAFSQDGKQVSYVRLNLGDREGSEQAGNG